MKKILLLSLVALMTISASAVNRKVATNSKFAKDSKTAMFSTAPFKNLACKMEAKRAVYNEAQPSKKNVEFKKFSRRADEAEPELIPAYSRWTYFYNSEVLGGFIPQIMYDGASFLVADGVAYFQPFSNLGYVEGSLNESADNPYAEYGAQVYTFNADIIASVTNNETGEVLHLSLEPCNVENYTAIRSGNQTFDGYYFPDENELYFPSDVCLGLFNVDGTETNVFDDLYVACRLDLEPQENINPYISKGTFTADSYYGADYGVSGECEILLTEDAYYVKGAGDATYEAEAWVEYDIDENVPYKAVVTEYQYIGGWYFYTDATRTSTYLGIAVTLGLLQSDGSLTGFNSANDYVSTYSITDNSDETTTIANTDNTVFGEYIFAAENDNSGMYNALDQKINITYEPAYETSIKNISADKAGKSTGVTYNLAGQQVGKNYKGIVIKNGVKSIQK